MKERNADRDGVISARRFIYGITAACATANRLGGNERTYAFHAAARMAFLSLILPGPKEAIAIAHLDGVIADCDRSIELWNGDYWLPHYIRSHALLEASRFDAAIDAADRTIKMMPNFAFPHSLRGRICRCGPVW
jgi:hypothetical protein